MTVIPYHSWTQKFSSSLAVIISDDGDQINLQIQLVQNSYLSPNGLLPILLSNDELVGHVVLVVGEEWLLKEDTGVELCEITLLDVAHPGCSIMAFWFKFVGR